MQTTGGKGSCGKEGLAYSITCNNCAERDIVRVYHGETSTIHTWEKASEDLDRKIDASVLLRHCRLDHNSELQDFTMSVTGLYRNDCILRQIAEGVSLLKRNVTVSTFLGLMVRGTNMGPVVVSFASVRAETKVFASLVSGIISFRPIDEDR